jgi:hypothetical protein
MAATVEKAIAVRECVRSMSFTDKELSLIRWCMRLVYERYDPFHDDQEQQEVYRTILDKIG